MKMKIEEEASERQRERKVTETKWIKKMMK